MKLGYSDFIDRHKTKFIIAFVVSTLLIFIPPVEYSSFLFNHNLAMNLSYYSVGVSIITSPLAIKNMYIHQLNNSTISDITFGEYFKDYLPSYILDSIGSLIFWFTIISLIIILVQYFKHKKVCKPLLPLPLVFYIVYVFVMSIVNAEIPFIGFYLAIILEVLVILYCAGFQRFPKPEPRSHKPSNRERIAELEQRIAKLERKDVE